METVTALQIDDALEAIAGKLRYMRPPLNHVPEAWHEDKSELLRAIGDLRHQVRAGVRNDQVRVRSLPR